MSASNSSGNQPEAYAIGCEVGRDLQRPEGELCAGEPVAGADLMRPLNVALVVKNSPASFLAVLSIS